jgi:hypothetical protein
MQHDTPNFVSVQFRRSELTRVPKSSFLEQIPALLIRCIAPRGVKSAIPRTAVLIE